MMSNKDQQNKQQQQQQPGGGGLQQQHGQQQASYQPQGMQQQGMQPQTHQQGQAMGGMGAAQFQMHPQGGSMMHGSGAGTQSSMGGQMGGMGGTSGGRQGMEGHGMGSGMGGGMGGTSGGMQGMESGQQHRMGMGGMESGQQRMGMGGGMEGGQQRMGMEGQRMGMGGGMEGGQQRMGMEGGQQHHRMEAAGGQQRTERRGSASEKGMCIGIIGTGEEGSTLIRKLSKHGYKVCMANDQKTEHLSRFAEETGACPCDMQDVVKNCDMVFLSIPEKAIMELPKGLFQNASKDLVVVDCCNYYPHRDGQIKELATGTMPESFWVQNQIGKTVVKAFNAILAGALHDAGCPKGSHERIAVPYAGDDARAKSMVAKVIEDLGFDAYDCGELNQSWKFQPGSPAYCTNLSLKEMESAIRGAKREDMPKLRDEAYQKMTTSQRHMDWRALSQMLRETYQTHKHIGGGMEKEKQQMGGGAQHMQQPTSA